MRMRRTPAASALGLLAAIGMASAGEPPDSHYEPLAFLVGHCWKGTFPDGRATDEHCFSWIYGGRFLRDEHIVHRGTGEPDDFGESVYVWNAASGQIEYLYIESAGGHSRGTVSAENGALVFPAASFTESGETRTYRSRWQRTAADAYDVVTEFRQQDAWVPGFTVHMRRETR
jgi:hypothetical protein